RASPCHCGVRPKPRQVRLHCAVGQLRTGRSAGLCRENSEREDNVVSKTVTRALGALALGPACAVLATAGPVSAQALAGKAVEYVIPFSEAGGSARWANCYAPFLSKELPGEPTVVVRYRPGAGSTEGANWFQRQTTPDGTLIFGTSGSTQFPYLLGDPRVRYEYKDWKVALASGTGG